MIAHAPLLPVDDQTTPAGVLRVARATEYQGSPPSDWQDHRRQPCSDDTNVHCPRINMAVADLPTYVLSPWALLRRESERDGLPVVNAKRVYRTETHNLKL